MKPTDEQRAKITSRHNALVQQARAVRDGREAGLIFVEGLRLAEEAATGRLQIEAALFSDRFTHDERGSKLLAQLTSTGVRATEVSERVLASVADTKSPQGIVLLARCPVADHATFEAAQTGVPLVVITHGVNNPANAGAMLRVAEAAGATGVIATAGSADLFSPKALRGAMGSTFRLPLWTGAQFDEALRWCAMRGVRSVATDVRAPDTHTDLDWTGPHAVILGAEAGGLAAHEAASAAARIRIPMRAPVESLNVATALAVVLYEAARQRASAANG